MTLSNILMTSGELLFGFMLVLMFLFQDRLVRFEKNLAVYLRYTRRRLVRRYHRYVRLKRAEKHRRINKKFLYVPAVPANPYPAPDTAA